MGLVSKDRLDQGDRILGIYLPRDTDIFIGEIYAAVMLSKGRLRINASI